MRDSTVPPLNPQPNSATAITPLLTRQDVAKALTNCLRSVDEAIASGELEIVAIGRSVRIRPSALEAYIEAHSTRRNSRAAYGGVKKSDRRKSNTEAAAGQVQ